MALSTSTQVPISDLNPGISTSGSVVHGIVTLIWPYSSVNQTFSFLLVEPDFRLRRQRGQVRISLRDSCARRVARAGLASGDDIYLAVDGAQWQKDSTATSTPGRGIEWELLYTDHLQFEKVSESGENRIVDTSRMSSSPELLPSSLPSSVPPLTIPSSIQTQSTPRTVPRVRGTFNTWSSPMFIKEKRLPDVFPLSSDLEAFYEEEEEEWLSGPPAKKLKFGRKSDQWHFAGRSVSPEAKTELQQVPQSVEKPRTPDPSSPIDEQIVLEPQTAVMNRDASGDPITEMEFHVEASAVKSDAESVPDQSIPEKQAVPASNNIAPQTSKLVDNPELDDFNSQSSIQDSTIMRTEEQPSGSRPVLDAFLQLPLETPIEQTTTAPEQDNNATETTHHQEHHMAMIEDRSLDLPQPRSPLISPLPTARRAASKTPEPHLEINIQSSTPLMQPISLNSLPLTPRLQPLLSPGLDLVSPIDQRHPIQAGYFARGEEVAVGLLPPSQVSTNSAPIVREIQAIETHVKDPNDSHALESAKQSIDKPQASEDIFFNKLLARYDEGTDQNSQPVADQSASSPAPRDNQLEATDAEHESTSSISDHVVPINQSSEIIVVDDLSHDQQDLMSDPGEAQNDETAETFKDRLEAEEIIESESEDSKDDNNTIIGKWRDATYKPSQETSTRLVNTASSPLLTQYLESIHTDNISNTQEELGELPSHAAKVVATPRDYKAIQDTYFQEDSHRDGTPSIKNKDSNDIEVVDLVDSDSSSISVASEDRPSPQYRDGEDLTVLEAIEDDHTTLSMVSPPSHNLADERVQAEISTTDPTNPDNHDKHLIETQFQEFYTAPIGFDGINDENTLDLTQITNNADEENSIDLLEYTNPATSIEGTPQKQANPVSEPTTQDSKKNTRSSQRITRSQNQQATESVMSGDDTTSEQLKSIQTSKHSRTNSTEVASQGFRTTNDYYSTLTTLSDFHNNLTSLLAVVAASSRPIRSTAGPRDFTQSVYLAAPNSESSNDFTIAQFFRPFSSALPYPLPTGSVILLKNFKVQSYKRKMSLLSTSTSAWAVFDQAAATSQSEMKVSIAGPPVDFGGAERGIAWGLGKWWTSLDHDVRTKITSAANTAKNQAEAELEKKAASARKTRDAKGLQLQPLPQTPRRQTRSSQSQSLDQISIPNTPSTHAQSPSPTHRRTRSSQQATTPTPTKTRHNLRSGLIYSDNETSQQNRRRESSDHEEDIEVNEVDQSEQPASQSQKSSSRAAANNASSQGTVRTRAQSKKEAAGGAGKKTRGEKALWHELRDGAVYKD